MSNVKQSNYVVAGNGKLKIGREYEVRHQRKGTFQMRVTGLRGEWIDGIVTAGKANAIMIYNIVLPGEPITIRDSFSYFIPLPKPVIKTRGR